MAVAKRVKPGKHGRIETASWHILVACRSGGAHGSGMAGTICIDAGVG